MVTIEEPDKPWNKISGVEEAARRLRGMPVVLIAA